MTGLPDAVVRRAGSHEGTAVATCALQWADPLWPDDGAAGYLHRFAVRRRVAGLGGRLLLWVDGRRRP